MTGHNDKWTLYQTKEDGREEPICYACTDGTRFQLLEIARACLRDGLQVVVRTPKGAKVVLGKERL